MKIALWVGAPSAATFLSSIYFQFLENIDFLFLLTVVALLIAIVPQLIDSKVGY